MNDIVLSSAVRASVLSLQSTSRLIDLTTLRLASGLKVNSALENPQNFFAAQSLKNTANDYNRLIDGISQSSRTVEAALIGVESGIKLLDQAEAVMTRSKEKLILGETDGAIYEEAIDASLPPLSSQIASANPDVYYPLNDGGPTADDLGVGGGVNATYNGGVTTGAAAIYSNGGTASADFDGNNGRVQVDDSNLINLGSHEERTVELVFNADDVVSRQVLYEEGGTVNSLGIYIDNNQVYFVGTDQGAWGPNSAQGPNNISAAIEAGETYHVAFVFNSTQNRFEGYINGASINSVTVNNTDFPDHNGDVGIGVARGGLWFDDGSTNGGGFNFNGRISDVAIYNTTLTNAQLLAHANSLDSTTTIRYRHHDFDNILDNLGTLIEDASYRGVNLLDNDNLITDFNPEGRSNLTTEGINLRGILEGIPRFDFTDLSQFDEAINKVREAREALRAYATTLASDLNIIQTRQDYTKDKVNTLKSGADDLTVADQNEEGANLLALSTRQRLGVTALNLVAVSGAEVLRLF